MSQPQNSAWLGLGGEVAERAPHARAEVEAALAVPVPPLRQGAQDGLADVAAAPVEVLQRHRADALREPQGRERQPAARRGSITARERKVDVVGARAREQRRSGPGHPLLARPDRGLEGFALIVGHRDPTLGAAVADVVQQRVHARGAHLGVLGEIVGRVEVGPRAPPLLGTAQDVMVERVQPRLAHVGVGGDVPGRVEEGVRVPRLPDTRDGIVADGVDPRRGDVGIGFEIVVGIDEVAGPKDADDVGPSRGGPRLPHPFASPI